jgi:ABC-type nitrate/sulfonate/bicarbonate transport system substrate-binding protein
VAPETLANLLPPLNPPVDFKVRVGNSLTTAPWFYALEKGYFRELGINFIEVTVQNSGDVAAPLATGELDAAGTAFGPGIYNAVKRDIRIVAVADNGQLNRGLASSAAIVKKGEAANYRTWCDMRGKRVAIPAKSTGLPVQSRWRGGGLGGNPVRERQPGCDQRLRGRGLAGRAVR